MLHIKQLLELELKEEDAPALALAEERRRYVHAQDRIGAYVVWGGEVKGEGRVRRVQVKVVVVTRQ